MMAYNFVLVTQVVWNELAYALAEVAGVPVGEVEVGDVDDPDGRTWETLVTCGYQQTRGDTTWYLDVTFKDGVPVQPAEPEVAARLADLLKSPVIYSRDGVRPDAHWLVSPNGERTRASLSEIDDPDHSGLWFDGVERRLPSVPDWVPVVLLSEFIRDYRIDKPALAEFRAWYDDWRLTANSCDDKTVLGVHNALSYWEDMVMRMSANWPPDGWYPVEFYRKALESRDELASMVIDRLSEAVRDTVMIALAQIDQTFRESTDPGGSVQLREVLGVPVEDSEHRAWWWQRIPTRPAWRPEQALPNPDMSRVTLH